MSVFYTRSNVVRRGVDFSHGGMTVQSDAADCDINVIMSRYKQTGVLPLNMLRNKKGIYADVSEFGDYRDCLNKVQAAEHMFMSMPSDVRARFQNNPALFLDFASNPRNAQELIDLGLATAPAADVKAPKQGAPELEPIHSAGGGAPGQGS